MNYNEIVNRFQEIVEDHKMLVDFGYGQISDIKTRSEGGGDSEGTDYPYLFLNPGTHQRNQQTITYNFNMIIMDMAREEEADEYQNFLNIQSDCIQYCDDVIARLYYHYKDKPEISFDVSYTPFYERFQDQLAGATAVITIQVPNPINECIAPFERIVPPVELYVLDANSTSVHSINPELGDNPQAFPDVILDTYDGMRPVQSNYYTITQDGNWTFVMTGTAVRTTDTASFPTGFNLTSQSGGVNLEADVSNWPTDPAVGVNFPFELRWNDVPLTVANGFVAFQTKNEPPLEDAGQTFPGVNIKGYYQAETSTPAPLPAAPESVPETESDLLLDVELTQAVRYGGPANQWPNFDTVLTDTNDAWITDWGYGEEDYGNYLTEPRLFSVNLEFNITMDPGDESKITDTDVRFKSFGYPSGGRFTDFQPVFTTVTEPNGSYTLTSSFNIDSTEYPADDYNRPAGTARRWYVMFKPWSTAYGTINSARMKINGPVS